MATPTRTLPPITTLTTSDVTSYSITPAALLTVAPEPTKCASSWMYELGNDGFVIQNFNYITDFDKCMPLAFRGTQYSPGVCRSGLEVKTVSQIVEVLDGGRTTGTEWRAVCCSP